MQRVAATIDSCKTAFQFAAEELPLRWREPQCRRWAIMAGGLTTLVWLLCCTSFSDRGPLVDVSAFSAHTGSQILDAVGIVHCLRIDDLTLFQAHQSSKLRGIAGIGLPTLVMMLGTVLWAMLRRPSNLLFCGALGSVMVVAVVAGTLSLVLAMLTGAATGLPIASGFGWVLTSGLRLAVSIGLLVGFFRTFDLAMARWRLWNALRRADEIRELPPAVDVAIGRFELVLGGVLGCVLLTWLFGLAITKETHISTYQDAVHRSLNNGDDESAQVAVERLLQLDPTSVQHRFFQALLHERAGRVAEAEAIIRDLAQSNGRRFEPAHRWLADHVARQRTIVVKRSSKQNGDAIARLETATRLDPSNLNAHVALAEIYLARRSPQQAIRELEQVVDERPHLRLTLARAALIGGQTDSARLHGELARNFYQQELDALPLSLETRMHLAASHVFLDEFTDAVNVLLKGWELSRDDSYQLALAKVYVAWHDAEARHEADTSRQLRLLEQSLKHDPDDVETLRRIAILATQEEPAGPAVDLLTRALNGRPIPASVHLTLGTNAYAKGRIANALRHLEEAYRLDSSDVQTLNNLACVLSESDPSALQRALALANDAIARDPNRATLRETRGQILAKLGRWSPAIADLETAMQVMPDHAGIHATLAEAYERLGDLALADEHRRRIN